MDRKNSRVTPQEEAGLIVSEFLEVAITCVVFLKGIYPCGAFERTRYKNLVVHRALHPHLRHYIHSTVTSLIPFFQQGLVDRVAVIFSGNGNVPVERFIFKLGAVESLGSNVEEKDLESDLRQFLIKLSISQPLTKALPKDCRWEITAYFRSLPQTSTNQDADMWIPTKTKQWQQLPLIRPIKSMSNGLLCLQLYVEQPNADEPKP